MIDQPAYAPGVTSSVCPVCLKRVSALRVVDGRDVSLVKQCPDHGTFETVIWRGYPEMNSWQRPKTPVHPTVCYASVDHRGCPFDCGLCEQHRQLPCSILVEVTDRCNLGCPVCFAGSGHETHADPGLNSIAFWFRRAMDVAGPCNVQISGGEPTMRDDLPEIVGIACATGFSFIQLNTNGLRLASEKDYAHALKGAGLASVFLQFDGVDDEIYRSLRGKALLEEKLLAIERCGKAGLGVVLVPTVVRGVNMGSLGSLLTAAIEMAPTVRGIHLQPMSYFGRYPSKPGNGDRITLPEVMRALEEQTNGMVKVAHFSPPGTEHSLCSFHATFIRGRHGTLMPILQKPGGSCCLQAVSEGVKRTVALVSQRWSVPEQKTSQCFPDTTSPDEPIDLDGFLDQVRSDSFTISCMAFQDAWNIDLERLKGCCISVVSRDGRLIPFCAYNLSGIDGRSLYREEVRNPNSASIGP
jgi:7,8-dihydro-6-hydroxymethylpterin dimethyltransferase